MKNVSNILTVARREFTVRIRARSFLLGSAVLVAGVLVFSFVPIIGRLIEGAEAQRIALYVGAPDLTGDPAATLTAVLNAAPTAVPPTGAPAYLVEGVTDLAAARDRVNTGTYSGALDIERAANGDLAFSFFVKDATSIRAGITSALVQQAAQALAVADRLAGLGINPTDQAALFAPAAYDFQPADPTTAGPGSNTALAGFGLAILVFLMIVLYGSWIAMSVVEEKSSRVIEVVLNAATPFQLLAGKVLGVGALASVQYVAILLAGLLALLLQGPVTAALLGEAGASGGGLPAGLDVGILALLGVYGVLGFLLYAGLFAAAGSLVNRQEDVNLAVTPMMLVATAGYLVAVYAATGLLDARSGWIAAIAQFPFFSPFIMLGRITAGQAGPAEVALSIVLLVLGIIGAVWLAARIYAAGVLLYGQRPSLLRVLRLIRTGQ